MNLQQATKKLNKKLRPALLLSSMTVITILISGISLPLAAATTDVIQDYGVGCGPLYWGVKGQNDESPSWFFGEDATCFGQSTYYGRYNVFAPSFGMNYPNSQGASTAWEAMIQGHDPWGINGSDAKPNNNNANFPLAATQSTHYNLKAQWLWTNDQTPLNNGMNANYLTDLWFCENPSGGKCPTSSDFVVIDFLWAQLSSSGGNWNQSVPPSYSESYCDKEGGINVFHYGVILNSGSQTFGTWQSQTTDIDSDITSAFNASYHTGSGYGNGQSCSDTYPGGSTSGHRSSFDIVDTESGIEIKGASTDSATVAGGYSYTELYY